MELFLQKFLRENPSFSQLEEKYHISAKRHPKYNNLVLFKYSQIESPFSENIVRESRGIILDQDNNWSIVSRAFDKFFNYGEGHAAAINWNSAKVQEKVDGSLCVVYNYDNQWHVATSGSPDAGGNVGNSQIIFRDYFWNTMENYGNPFASLHPSSKSFYFELTGQGNRVVVVHQQDSLTLLGARDLKTQQEYSIAEASTLLSNKIPMVKAYPLQSFDEIQRSFKDISPLSQEGYVVVDNFFNRVKVKHPGYVALHHAKDGLTLKAFVEIARSGETSEVLSAFPEFRPMLEEAQSRVNKLAAELEEEYSRIKHIPSQKEFAFAALKTRCPSVLFQYRAGKFPDIRLALKEIRLDNLMAILGY
jgi:RNA ligase-like protein